MDKVVDKIRQELDNDKERRDNDDDEDNDEDEDNDDNETESRDNVFVCLFVCRGAWLYSPNFLASVAKFFCCFVPCFRARHNILGLIEGQPRYTNGEKFIKRSAEEKI